MKKIGVGKYLEYNDPKAPWLKAKELVVRAQWYLSTAEDHRAKRQGYKLLPDYCYIKVSTIIQEHGLSFRHAGREGSASESILEEVEHDRIMAGARRVLSAAVSG